MKLDNKNNGSYKKDNPNNLLDGKKTAEKIKVQLKKEIKQLLGKPSLAVVLVGDDASSRIYVSRKEKACQEVGINSLKINLPTNIKEEDLIRKIVQLNQDPKINGILVQLPLPSHINKKKVFESINWLKDVDGFNPQNIGDLNLGQSFLIPCTPQGIMELLDYYQVDLKSRDVVLVGKSDIVGKPLIPLFLEKEATVTVCHSHTKNLKDKTKDADILIVAAGKPNLIKTDMVKDKVIVIDVGINKIPETKMGRNGKLSVVGDVDFEKIRKKAKWITPVPGGVGPMTIAMLLKNTIKAYKLQKKDN